MDDDAFLFYGPKVVNELSVLAEHDDSQPRQLWLYLPFPLTTTDQAIEFTRGRGPLRRLKCRKYYGETRFMNSWLCCLKGLAANMFGTLEACDHFNRANRICMHGTRIFVEVQKPIDAATLVAALVDIIARTFAVEPGHAHYASIS